MDKLRDEIAEIVCNRCDQHHQMENNMKTYVTFGQEHTHSVNGKTFDKGCIAVIEAEDAKAGRELAFEHFGDKFFTTYYEDQFDKSSMHFYPRGYIEVVPNHISTPDLDKDKLEFNPDWDMLEASQEALKEHMRELNRLHDLTKDIVWVGECISECERGIIKGRHPEDDVICYRCNGIGTITRQATLEEILTVTKHLMNLADITKRGYFTKPEHIETALTTNNGTLKIKEKS